eukprot:gene11998-15093_t
MGLKPGEDEPVGLEGQQSSGDLDFQELGESKNLGYSDQRRRIVYSVLGFDAMDRQLPCNDDSLLEGVVTALGRRVADLSGSGTTALSPFMVGLPKLNQSRLGPAVVNVDRVSAFGQLSYSPNGLILESLSNFSSVRASACVYSGKWQYEVVLHTAGIQQIGWATVYCPFTTEEGVGDAPDSYAYDGKRIRKWNVKCQPYGQPWAPGDVIGALVDLDAGEVSFMRNGESMGVAYPTIRTMQPHLAYFPALSLSYTEKAEVNFGGRPFLYPAPKHLPLQLAPTGGRLELGAYLSQCVKRLALASQSVVGTSSAGNLSRPCDLSAHSDDPPGLEEDKDELQTLPPQGQGLFQSIPDGPRAGKASKVLGADQQQLEWEDAWLLGSAIGDQIGAMLQVPPTYTVSSPLPRGGHATAVEYFVHGQLLPALISLHGARAPHDVASTCAAARLLQMGLETATFEAVGGCLLEALALTCCLVRRLPAFIIIPFIIIPSITPFITPFITSLTCCLVRRLPAFIIIPFIIIPFIIIPFITPFTPPVSPASHAACLTCCLVRRLPAFIIIPFIIIPFTIPPFIPPFPPPSFITPFIKPFTTPFITPFITSLTCCLVRRLPAFKSLWLRHSNFDTITEWLMSRKPLGPEDIKGLLPAVWWRGCRDETAAEERMKEAPGPKDIKGLLPAVWWRGCRDDKAAKEKMKEAPGPEDIKGFLPAVRWAGCRDNSAAEERMKYALVAFESAVVKVEDVQYELLTSLIGEADARAPSQGGGRLGSQPGNACTFVFEILFNVNLQYELLTSPIREEDAWAPSKDAMISFFRRLVLRNRGANRDMLPPGLSDPNVLVSVWFILLRLLWGALGDLKQFPRPPCRDPVLDSLKPEWVVELLSMSMALYSLRVVTSVRQIQTMLLALSSSIASLEEVERHMVRGRGAGQGSSSSSHKSRVGLEEVEQHMVRGRGAGLDRAAAAAAATRAELRRGGETHGARQGSRTGQQQQQPQEQSLEEVERHMVRGRGAGQGSSSSSSHKSRVGLEEVEQHMVRGRGAGQGGSSSSSHKSRVGLEEVERHMVRGRGAGQSSSSSSHKSRVGLEEVEQHMVRGRGAGQGGGSSSSSSHKSRVGLEEVERHMVRGRGAGQGSSSGMNMSHMSGVPPPAVSTASPSAVNTSSPPSSDDPSSSAGAAATATATEIANVLASALSEQETADLDSMGGAQGAGTTPSFSRLHVHNPLHFASSFGGATPTPSTPSPAMPTPSGGEPSSSVSASTGSTASASATPAGSASSGVSASTGSTASASASAAAAAAGSGASGSAALQQNQWQETRTFLRLDIASNGRCGLLLETTFYSGWRMDALMCQADWTTFYGGWKMDALMYQTTFYGGWKMDALMYQTTFYSGWKMDALMYQAGWVSHMLLQASTRGSVLSYIPNCFVEMVVDSITALRRSIDSVFNNPQKPSLLTHPFTRHLPVPFSDFRPLFEQNDIACSKLVPYAISIDFLPLFEQNEMACSKLVPNAISMFDSRLWHPVSAVLLRLTHGSGFGNSAKEQGGRSVRLSVRCTFAPDSRLWLRKLCEGARGALSQAQALGTLQRSKGGAQSGSGFGNSAKEQGGRSVRLGGGVLDATLVVVMMVVGFGNSAKEQGGRSVRLRCV